VKAGTWKKLEIPLQIYKRGLSVAGVWDPAVQIALGDGGGNNNMILR